MTKNQIKVAISQQKVISYYRELANTCRIDLGGLIQLSVLNDDHQCLDPNATGRVPYGQHGTPGESPTVQPSAYPLTHATLHSALLLLSEGWAMAPGLFSQPERRRIGHPSTGIRKTFNPSTDSAWPSDRSSTTTASHRPTQPSPTLTLSTPVSGSSNLILAQRTSSKALASQTVPVNGATHPAISSTIHQQQGTSKNCRKTDKGNSRNLTSS